MTPGRVIGRAGAIPWREPEDLRHFKRATMGHAVVMGRKTHESIGRPLPGRRNVVITRNTAYHVGGSGDGAGVHTGGQAASGTRGAGSGGDSPGSGAEMGIAVQPTRVDVVHSLDAALGLCRERAEEKAFVIGGAEIYALALPVADELIVTHIDRDDIAGDAYFPAFRAEDWVAEPVSRDGDLRIVRYIRTQ